MTQKEKERLLYELKHLLPNNTVVQIDTGINKYNSVVVGIDKCGTIIRHD